VNGRPKGGVRCRLTKRFAAQSYRAVGVPGRHLDGAHEDERLGTGRIVPRFGKCLFCESTRAPYVSGSEMSKGAHNRPSVPPVAIVAWRQLAGEVAELRGDLGHAPDTRDGGRLVERRSDLDVGTLRSKRKVASTLQWIADDLSEHGV
jgi:hypothetical protein